MAKLKSPISAEDLTEVEATAPLWMISFADLSLLLLIFFILMLAMSNQQEIHDEDLLRILASLREGFGHTPEPEKKELDTAILQVLARQDKGRRQNKMRWMSPAVEGGRKQPIDLFAKAQGAVGWPILFDPDSAQILLGTEATIDEIAEIIRHHYRLIIIEGHCSEEEARDDPDGGYLLAYERALAVKQALQTESVGPSRIRILVSAHYDTRREEEGRMQRRAVVKLGSYYMPGSSELFERKPRQVYTPQPLLSP